MNQGPIGVFDSGVGGLTAVRALRELLPGEDIVYFADTANVPYGGRSVPELRSLAASAARLLRGEGAKALLVACGTISSNCIGEVGLASGLPYCGVLLPAAREAAGLTVNGRVGVLSTEATARSGAFERAIRGILPGAAVFTCGTPLLVPLAEAGRTDWADAAVRAAAERSVAPLLGRDIDTLVLGCTHFPLLAGAISRAMGGGVRLVDSGAAGARECAALLSENGLLNPRRKGGTLRCIVSGDAAGFECAARYFLPGAAMRVERRGEKISPAGADAS